MALLRIIRFNLCVAAALAAPAYAGADVNNYNFFVTDEGLRTLGMGGAGFGAAEGYEGLLVNPAGLAYTPFPQVHLDWQAFAGHNGGNLCFAGWHFGAGIRYFNLWGTVPTAYPPVAAFGGGGTILDFAYGRRVGAKFALGGGVKLFGAKYGKYQDNAGALDVAASYRLTTNLTAAAGVKNLGGKIFWPQMITGPAVFTPAIFYIPADAVAGMGYKLARGQVLVVGDVHVPLHANGVAGLRGDPIYIRAGVEYRPWSWFGVQGGYRSGLDELGVSISLGGNFRFSDLDVDVAGMPGANDDTYIASTGKETAVPTGAGGLGITYSFGRSRKEGVEVTEKRLREQFEQQKKVMVGQLMGNAEKFYAQGMYDDAVETLNEILVWDPDYQPAADLLAEAEGRAAAARVAEHLTRAKADLEAGSVADAIVEAKEALALDAGNAEAAKLLATAEERLAAASGVAESETKTLLSSAQKFYEAGDFAGAIAKWSAVLAREPGNRVAAVGIADAQTRMSADEEKNMEGARAAEAAGRLVEARRDYKAALAANAANAEARDGYERVDARLTAEADAQAEKAAAALAEKDFERAETLAYAALEYKPNHARAKSVLAAAGEARRAGAVKTAAPQSRYDVYMKGIQAYTAHNYAAALSYWQQIPPDDPLYAKAQQNIARAKAVLKKLGE